MGSARLLQDGAFQGLQTELEGMGSEVAHGFLLPAPGIALRDTGPGVPTARGSGAVRAGTRTAWLPVTCGAP